MQLARVAGGIGTLYVAGTSFMDLKSQGYTSGRAILHAVFGYDKTAPADEGIGAKVERALDNCWWPAVGGELAHQLIGNPQGAWGTGFGMKLNNHTPKGMNL